MSESNNCPICGMLIGDRIVSSTLAPSMCWLETTRSENGFIQMKFGYGDDFDHLLYRPTYCPECGSKITKVTERRKTDEMQGTVPGP